MCSTLDFAGGGEPLKSLPESERSKANTPRSTAVLYGRSPLPAVAGRASDQRQRRHERRLAPGSAGAVLDGARRKAVFSYPERWSAGAGAAVLSTAFSRCAWAVLKRAGDLKAASIATTVECALMCFAPTAIRQQLLEVHPGPLYGSLASDQDSDLAGLGPLCRAEEHRGSVRPWCDFNDTQAESFDRKPGMWVYL